MHTRMSVGQDLKILSTKDREGGEATRNWKMTSGKKSAEASTRGIDHTKHITEEEEKFQRL